MRSSRHSRSEPETAAGPDHGNMGKTSAAHEADVSRQALTTADQADGTRIRYLESQVQTLQSALDSKNANIDRRLHAEFGRIRDAWKEKLDAQKQTTADLRKELHELRKSHHLLEAETKLLPEYRHRLAALEEVLNAQRQKVDTLEAQKAEGLRGVTHHAQVRPDVLSLSAENARLQTKVEELSEMVERWRQAAQAYATGTEENWSAVDPSTLQMKLAEDLVRFQAVELARNSEKAEMCKLQRENAELQSVIGSIKREITYLASELEEKDRSLEVASNRERELSAQLCVLRKCVDSRSTWSGADTGDLSIGARISTAPATEPAPGAYDQSEEKETQLSILRQQLQQHKDNEKKLREDLTTAERKIVELQDKDAEISDLRDKLEKSYHVRHQLVNEIQKLTVEAATRPPTGTEASSGTNDNLLNCLRKERDSAIKRADAARLDHRYKQEVLAIMVQKVLGWKVSVEELRRRTQIALVAQSAFSPPDDPGVVRVSADAAELVPLLPSNELKGFAQRLLEDGGASNSFIRSSLTGTPRCGMTDDECTTPISSQPGAFEPKLSLSFNGRYRERWRRDTRWRQQLEMRRPFATFLAFMTLDEHHARQRRAGWKQPPADSPAARLLLTAD